MKPAYSPITYDKDEEIFSSVKYDDFPVREFSHRINISR